MKTKAYTSKSGDGKISFSELVETRKFEMQSMLPGLMTEVSDGKNKTVVYSPSPMHRSQFSIDKS